MGDIRELKGFTRGQIDAALMQIGDQTGMGTAEAIKALLRGELAICLGPKFPVQFTRKGESIFFEVTSDGTTGREWVERLEKRDVKFPKTFEDVLTSKRFIVSIGSTYKIGVFSTDVFGSNIEKRIRGQAREMQLAAPSIEAICLIADKFSHLELKNMGFSRIVVMHNPIKIGEENIIFEIVCDDRSGITINAPGYSDFNRSKGLAFITPRVLAQDPI